jgi:rhomboid protease GluP
MPAILCPSCGKLISSNAPECIFCGQRRPGLWGMTQTLRRWQVRLDFTKLIMGSCVAVYVLALLSDPKAIFQPSAMMNILAPSDRASFRFGMTGAIPVFGLGHWWTLITAIYLHGGLLHIFFNMMWVRQLGPVVEEIFGPFRLFIIFTVAGIAGFVASAYMGHAATLGASGAIFGLLAAAIVYGRQTGSSLFTRQFLQWAAILFVSGLVFPGIDNWAHAGGFAGGYASSYLLARDRRPEGLGAWIGGAVCLLATVAAFALQLRAVLGMRF